MIDVRLLRTDLERVKTALARKGVEAAEVERAASLDSHARELASRRDELRARANTISKDSQQARKAGDTDKAQALVEDGRQLKGEEKEVTAEAAVAEAELREALLRIPNLPNDDAPDGAGPEENVVVRIEGFDPDSYGPHQRVPHWDTGAALGILDMERGAKIAGSMFAMYRKGGATLTRALCQLALDRNSDAFEEIRPPTLARTDTLIATGQLPKFADDAYQIERDDLWAIPTAEVPLTSIGRDEVLAEADLPMRLMAYTPCYRREAGAAGRDTRGMIRQHQFDKVEVVMLVRPEDSEAALDTLTAHNEDILRRLGLPYRVVSLCTGDLGFSAAKTYDLEVWLPGMNAYKEISSCSNFDAFQARRASIRFRRTEGEKPEFVHTLNGSGLPVGRTMVAILENYQRADGSVAIPEALVPSMRGQTEIRRA